MIGGIWELSGTILDHFGYVPKMAILGHPGTPLQSDPKVTYDPPCDASTTEIPLGAYLDTYDII